MERIVSFSDAVMAIAITLLAINIRVPQIDPRQAAQAGPGAGGAGSRSQALEGVHYGKR